MFIDYICGPIAAGAAAVGAERIGNLKDGIMKRLAVIMLCVALPLWILSCGRCGKTGNGETVAGAAAAGEVVIADSLPVKVQVRDGCGRMVILKEPGRTVDVEFDSGGCDLLYGEITGVGDMANVRFNQIVMPDGTSDGPFGRSIEYGLEQQGTCHLLIGESLMAGEPWGGEFMLELWLGCKVPYTEGHNYFVNNSYTEDRLPAATITTREEFDTVFGKAPVMGSLPTPVDFDTQYVIAVIEPMTDEAVYLEVESLVKIGDKLIMTYSRETGDRRSYSVRPMLMLVVDREYAGEVEIVME